MLKKSVDLEEKERPIITLVVCAIPEHNFEYL